MRIEKISILKKDQSKAVIDHLNDLLRVAPQIRESIFWFAQMRDHEITPQLGATGLIALAVGVLKGIGLKEDEIRAIVVAVTEQAFRGIGPSPKPHLRLVSALTKNKKGGRPVAPKAR